MKALILGASGLVGGNCLKHFTEEGWECLGTHFGFETTKTQFYNVLDPDDENNADVEAFQPDLIVHCGALTHVDYCEENPDESYENTVKSTENALLLARKLKAHFVYLSTDYVFDGEKGYYCEDEPVNPLSVYAEHKLQAERLVQEYFDGKWLILRITNVYGDEVRGKNFVSRLVANMQKQEQMHLRLPVDQYATPVNAWDVARAIHDLLSDKKFGIYHLGSTDYLNRVQLAQRIHKYFGHEKVTIEGVLTRDLKQAAKRPLNGGFSTAKFNKEYPTFAFSNVDDYLQKLKYRA